MRVRLVYVTGLCLLVAGWQGCIDASLRGCWANHSPTSTLSLEKQPQAESSTDSIEFVGSFPGQIAGFIPDGRGVATYEFDGKQTRIFSLDGTELMSFSDAGIRFAPNGQLMALMSPGGYNPTLEYTTCLMTLKGKEIASFSGLFPTFTLEAELLIIQDQDDQRSRLVNFAGAEIAVLEGTYFGPILGPKYIVTSSEIADRYYFYLYDLNGVEIAAFPGDSEGWIEMLDYQNFLVSEADQTRWFDRSGVVLATYPGTIAGTLPDSQAIFLYSRAEDTTRLVGLDGEEIASYAGLFSALAPDNQSFVTGSFEDDITRIYALDGTEIAVISGDLREFVLDGEGIIISSRDQQNSDDQKSSLYTFEGVEIATYMGKYATETFLPDSGIVITSTSQQPDIGPPLNETHLHSPEGRLLATVEGSFDGISPDHELLAVSSNDSRQTTDLYRILIGE